MDETQIKQAQINLDFLIIKYMKIMNCNVRIATGLLCLLSFTSSKAAIVTQYYGTADLPQTILGSVIEVQTGLDPGYAALINTSHTESGGTSTLSFARYRAVGSSDCQYWFRSNSDLSTMSYADSWDSVHWLGNADNSYVDSAQTGSDNFIGLTISGQTAAILQFSFDNTTQTARMVASAVDESGLTFAQGIAAIQAVPEPSATALLGLGGLALLLRRCR